MLKIFGSIFGVMISIVLIYIFWPLIIAGGVLCVGAVILLAPAILLGIVLAKLFKKKSWPPAQRESNTGSLIFLLSYRAMNIHLNGNIQNTYSYIKGGQKYEY